MSNITRAAALESAQPIGRLIRRKELAQLAGRSVDWVDHQFARPDNVLVAKRTPAGRIMVFTEASVRKLLGCEIKEVR